MLRSLRLRKHARALGSRNAREREEAIAGLAALEDAVAEEPLRTVLLDPDPLVRSAALAALAALARKNVLPRRPRRPAAEVEHLLRSLADDSPVVRGDAVALLEAWGEGRWHVAEGGARPDLALLGAHDDPRRIVPLLHASRSPAAERRGAAIRGLALVDDESARSAVRAALADARADVRRIATELVGGWKREADRDALVRRLDDADLGVRVEAARALGHLGAERSATALARALGCELARTPGAPPHEAASARFLADLVAVLAATPGAESDRALLGALGARHPAVVLAAVRAVAGRAPAGAAEPLARLLGAPAGSELQLETIRALGRLGEAASLDVLLPQLKSPSPAARLEACGAIGRLGNPAASETLRGLLVHPDATTRKAAASALAALGEARWEASVTGGPDDLLQLAEAGLGEALPCLLEALRTGASRSLPRVAQLCARHDRPGAVDALLENLSRHGPSKETVEAIGSLGDPRAIEPLTRSALLDPYGPTRLAAARALAALGETSFEGHVQGDEGDVSRLASAFGARFAEAIGRLIGTPLTDVAARVLADVDPSRAGPLLLAHLSGKQRVPASRPSLQNMLRLIERLRPPGTIEVLERCLVDLDAGRRVALAQTLERVAAAERPAGQAPRYQTLVDGQPSDFAHLGTLGNPTLIDPLIGLVGNAEVGVHVYESLADLLAARALAPMLDSLSTGRLQQRRAKAKAVVRLVASCPELRSSWPLVRASAGVPHADHFNLVHTDRTQTVHKDHSSRHHDCMINGVPHIDERVGSNPREVERRHTDTRVAGSVHRDMGIGVELPAEPPEPRPGPG